MSIGDRIHIVKPHRWKRACKGRVFYGMTMIWDRVCYAYLYDSAREREWARKKFASKGNRPLAMARVTFK